MSTVYQVRVEVERDPVETVIEFGTGHAMNMLPLEKQAQSFAAQPIIKRWREQHPLGSVDPRLTLLSVWRLPDTETENVRHPGLGPYQLAEHVRAWITNAPNSWGMLGPRPKY
jgi:hypothetical protein